MKPEPSYTLDNLGDGRTAVLVGDLVIGTVGSEGDLFVGRTWTSSRTMPHATQGEVVTEIWRVWRDSTASRRAGLLPERLRYVTDAVAAVRLDDGWAVELTDAGHVLVTPAGEAPRVVRHGCSTGTWTLFDTASRDTDHRTLQAVVDQLADRNPSALRPTDERYLVEAGA